MATPKDIDDVKMWLMGISKSFDPNSPEGPYQIRRNAYEYSDQFDLSIYLNDDEGFVRICVDGTNIEQVYSATEVELLRGMNEVCIMAVKANKKQTPKRGGTPG